MAKTETVQESPADRVKRELAEREQRNKEAEAAKQEQPTADRLSAEEIAVMKAADQEDSKDRRIRELEQRLARQDNFSTVHGTTLAGDALQEDPAIVAERRARFQRAEEFERQRALRRPAAAVPLSPQPYDEETEDPFLKTRVSGDGTVNVKMPSDVFDVIYKLATSIPLSTPPEHVMMGYGGIKVNVGMIRAMAGVRMR